MAREKLRNLIPLLNLFFFLFLLESASDITCAHFFFVISNDSHEICNCFIGSDMICDGTLYGIRPLVACLPAWCRFVQCLRRFKDTRQVFPHLVNAGKYSTSFFVVAFSTLGNGLPLQAWFNCREIFLQ